MRIKILDNATGQLEIKVKGREILCRDLDYAIKGGKELVESAKIANARGFTKFQHGGKWHRIIPA